MLIFDHIRGEMRHATWQEEQDRLRRIESAMHEIWQMSGCFRTDHAEGVLCDVHDIAAAALNTTQGRDDDGH